MKSRTSFFNGTIFKKNLTRFAPVWGLYTLCLLLGLALLMDTDVVYWFPAHYADLINFMSIINLCYALLVAQVLFGDLYNTRMCNALHAMPLRRECWFFTNVFSGIFFSLLPTVIMTAASVPLIGLLSSMIDGWQIPLYWLLANTLEYLFFFGVAVFSAFCVGNRVGMAMVYTILNFFSYLVFALMDTVYVPVLHGVILQEGIFQMLCPVAWTVGATFLDCTRHQEFIGYTQEGYEKYDIYGTFQVTGDWWYLWIIAAVGVVLILVALLMYRRRKLECAGDLIATRKLEPVFMVLFSLTAAVVFHFVITGIMGYSYDEGYSIFLFIGLTVGWFAGRMLLERQVSVFRRGKNWLGLILLAAIFGLTMYVNTLDPFGVVNWTPEVEEVKQVTFGMGYRGQVSTDDPEEIADAIRLHELALEEMLTSDDIARERAAAVNVTQAIEEATYVTEISKYNDDYRKSCSLYITYELKNGWTARRDYYIWLDSEAGELLNRYTSSVEAVFSDTEHVETAGDLMAMAAVPNYIYIEGVPVSEELLTKETVENLFRAIIADCEAGTMTQYQDFHAGRVLTEEDAQLGCYSVDLHTGPNGQYYYINIYADSENCLAWLESLGILDTVKERVAAYYG